jgi:hypothetical protein
MPDVEFSEEEAYKAEINRRAATMGAGAHPWSLSELTKKLGLARDQASANIVLGIMAVVAALAAIIIFLSAR